MTDDFFFNAEKIKSRLESLGVLLWVDHLGNVRGRSAKGDIPLEAWKLIDRMGMFNEQIAEMIRSDPRGVRRAEGLSAKEVVRMKMEGRAEIELIVVDKQAGLCEVFYREGSAK